MQQLNLKSRIFMFCVCSSIEYDIKQHILSKNDNIDFTSDMIEKIEKRLNSQEDSSVESKINVLDLLDFIEIIKSNPYQYGLNNDEVKRLIEYFNKIIPIRNRVMHTKPLELGDRAILQEVLENVDKNLNFINWTETITTRKIVNESPELLIEKCKPIIYKDDYYHNLPEPEFDDTGYIGRKKEIEEITNLILDDRFQIISIIGNGGIGKTAIAVKILYDLIDNPKNKYDAIVWTSLKARTLSNGEFVDIQNSLKDMQELIESAEKSLIIDEDKTSEENVLEFMKNFKTLLVIDNLETINDETINAFLKNIPFGSKVLITSRTGLGELEIRYQLSGMNSHDGIKYFRELSKYYGIDCKKEDKVIKKLVEEVLYSNPLSIKWYITGIHNGIKEEILQNKREELIEFCMSNVYNKLNDVSKEILGLFQIEDYEMSYGEIDYYINYSETEIKKAINQLLATNMMELKNSNYQINMMAKDYLQLNEKLALEFVIEVTEKKKKLNDTLQDIKVNKENNILNPTAVLYDYENKDNKIAAIYLNEALKLGKERAFDSAFQKIDKACSIAPNYFECYKTKAFLNAENKNITEAISNYDIAIKKCVYPLEYATVYYMYSIFYTSVMPDNEKAYSLIDDADKKLKGDVQILLQKVRTLTRLGKYKEAEEIIKKVDDMYIVSDKIKNIKASVKANLYQKWSETYETRDIKMKFDCIKKGIDSIEELEKIDIKTCACLLKLLKSLAYMYYHREATELLIECLKKHINEIKSVKSNNMNSIKNIIIDHRDDIDEELYKNIEKYIVDYKKIAKNIKNTNIGIIVYINIGYGFIDNFEGSKYFSIGTRIKEKLFIGDIVKFDVIDSNDGRKRAINIKKISQNYADYE